MLRTITLYGAILAASAFALQWLEYHYAMRKLDTNLYIVALAVIFIAIGVWAGLHLVKRKREGPFQPNEKALAALGISAREREVLELLAAGHANKEIARLLDISPNTVKTHVTSVFAKLEVARRTQAIQKARALEILP
ncbi:MAG: response regulator transcription factor [Proteobacteria bacterium]|nr:response regulator transcription factor [Pseudomonadota bacterium]